MSEPEPRHFSMIRGFHLADVFTMANGACGVAAIFAAIRYAVSGEPRHLVLAACLIPLAIAFDFLDGRVARWRHTSSPMGREMDSLADVVSFGVAPAAVAYAAGLDGVGDQAILLCFAACGLSRLARYNVTAEKLAEGSLSGKVAYFEGTPITFSIIPLTLLLLALQARWSPAASPLGLTTHLMALPFLVSGGLMISKTIRIPKP